MGCGCGGGRRRQNQRRIVNTVVPNSANNRNTPVVPNNTRNIAGVRNTKRTSRNRIARIRKEAIRRALGKG